MAQTENTAQSDDIAEQLRVIRADIARLAEMVGERASTKAEAARDTASTVAADARARADIYRAEAGRKSAEAYKAGQDAVRKHPTLAIGLALGAGALLGRTVLRRI